MFLTEAKREVFTIKYYRGVAQLGDVPEAPPVAEEARAKEWR